MINKLQLKKEAINLANNNADLEHFIHKNIDWLLVLYSYENTNEVKWLDFIKYKARLDKEVV